MKSQSIRVMEYLFSSLNKAHFITKLFAAVSYTNAMWKWFACGSVWPVFARGGCLMKECLSCTPERGVM